MVHYHVHSSFCESLATEVLAMQIMDRGLETQCGSMGYSTYYQYEGDDGLSGQVGGFETLCSAPSKFGPLSQITCLSCTSIPRYTEHARVYLMRLL